MLSILNFVKEYAFSIGLIIVGIAVFVLLIRAIIDFVEYMRYYKQVTSPEAKNTFFASSECDGVLYYYAKVKKENTATEYRVPAEIRVHTLITEKSTRFNTFETINTRTTYYLQHICWNNGGRPSFAKEIYPGEYTFPLLKFDKELIVTDSHGKVYHITLLDERVEVSQAEILQTDREKRKLKKFQTSVYKDIDKLLKDKECQHEIAADIISKYREHLNLRVAEELQTKPWRALKGSKEVVRLTKELRKIEKKYLSLKFQFEKLSKERKEQDHKPSNPV